jgi:HD-GYP domain-containing protein (c-di-GMP phosphodiesterase class II)
VSFDLPARTSRHLEEAARLHDVGKAHIDEQVLTKPSALTPQEWAIVRAHPRIGFDVVRGAVEPEIAQMVLYHHERFDGFGYPHGLAGDRIPLGARILSTIDAFDAMVSERPYSPMVPVGEAIGELHRCAGSQFDPDVVEVVAWALEGEFAGDITRALAG